MVQDCREQVHAQSTSQLIRFCSEAREDLHARLEEGKARGLYADLSHKAEADSFCLLRVPTNPSCSS